jgi:hypothetical protein
MIVRISMRFNSSLGSDEWLDSEFSSSTGLAHVFENFLFTAFYIRQLSTKCFSSTTTSLVMGIRVACAPGVGI